MKTVEVVGAVIVNARDEIFCALRSQAMSLSGMWEFPGGKVEAGETHQETLAREITEELGCTIQVGDFVAECSYEYPNVVVHLFTYYAYVVTGIPAPREHERLEWVPLDKIEELHWAPADLPTVNKLIDEFRRKSPG